MKTVRLERSNGSHSHDLPDKGSNDFKVDRQRYLNASSFLVARPCQQLLFAITLPNHSSLTRGSNSATNSDYGDLPLSLSLSLWISLLDRPFGYYYILLLLVSWSRVLFSICLSLVHRD